MRIIAFLSGLALFVGCADAGLVQPEAEVSLSPVMAAAPAGSIKNGMEFVSTLQFVRTVEAGAIRDTPGVMQHGLDWVNEFRMEGDLEGFWYFQGDYHANLKTGAGRSIAKPALIDIQSSRWGMIGTFECNLSAKWEYLDLSDPLSSTQIQYGNTTGCKGSGDFAGMRMNAYFTNEASPGFLGIYDFSGVIW